MKVRSVPEGQHSITAYLGLSDASEAIDFYVRAFCAEQVFRLDTPQGKVGHAELRIGDSALMIADACADGPFDEGKRGSIALHLYVDNVDARFARAIQAGARVVSAVQDQFYGDRSGTLEDPYGVVWFVATHKEDLTAEEVQRRAGQLYSAIGAVHG